MAQIDNGVLCATAMLALWTILGLPIALRLVPGAAGPAWAPTLGWAIYSAIALPLFGWIGMTRGTVLAATGLAVVAACVAVPWRSLREGVTRWALWPIIGVTAAVALACIAAAAILPKTTSDGITLSAQIYDHAKIAMVDEAIRAGVPITNPFFHEVS